MFQLLQLLFFAATDTLFALHLWTCTNHNSVTAFVTALIAGGFWTLAIAAAVDFYNERRERR